MSADSNIVLRWVIDDAKEVFARKKAESGVFNHGGFKWRIALHEHAYSSKADISLSCNVGHNGPWECEVEAGLYALDYDGYFPHFTKKRVSFDENNRTWMIERFESWSNLKDQRIHGQCTHEFRIKIINSDRGQPLVDSTIFDAPNRRSDVVLKIQDGRLHVSKEYLAVHSPVFETLFFGNFAENGKAEVEIKDVVYHEFLDLLHLIYFRTMEITDRTVPHILKLADQFQMESILEHAKEHLTNSMGFDTMKKLVLADRYKLDALREHLLQSFTSSAQITEKIKSSSEYSKLSGDMKIAICDRIAQL